MKRFLSLFLAFIFVIGVFFSTPVIASAEGDVTTPEVVDPYEGVTENDFSTEGLIKNDAWIYYRPDEAVKEVYIKAYTNTDNEKITISEGTITLAEDVYTVVGIEANAFEYCDSLDQITIPTTITAIDEKAFTGCDSLQRIVYKGHLEDWEVAFKGTLGENVLSTTVCQDATISYVGNENTIIATCGACQKKCGTLTLEANDSVYNGNSHKVAVKVAGTVPGYTEGAGLSYSVKDGVDEEAKVIWKPLENNVLPKDAGEYVAKLILVEADEGGNGEVSATANFTINPKTVTEITIENIDAQTYTGSQITPDVVVKDGENVLTKDVDYTVTYGDNVNAGIDAGTVTVTLSGNYSYGEDNQAIKTFTITPKTVSQISIGDIDAQTYTGSQITPDVTVTINDETQPLVATEYEVTYGENVNAGENAGTVTVTLSGNYSYGEDNQATKTFTITPHDHTWTYFGDGTVNSITAKCVGCPLGDTRVTISLICPTIEELVYNGQSKTVSVYVSDETANVIRPDKVVYTFNDEEVTECINVGTYKATITIGEAKASINFKITTKDLSDAVTVEPIADQVYTGEEIVPAVDVKYNGKSLTLGTDYTVSYINSINVGTATATITFIGNYDGSKKVDFKIVPKTITVELMESSGEYNGKAHTPSVDFDNLCGNETLVKDTDYTIGYSDDTTNVGDVIVTVTLKNGNYTFVNEDGANTLTASLTYDITPKAVSQIVIEDIAAQTYTGNKLEPSVTVKINGESEPLVLGTDYTVTYGDNENAGIGSVTVLLDSNYSYTGDEQLTKTFTINPKTISAGYQIGEDGIVYNGAETLQPKIIFTEVDDSSVTIDNVDCEVKYYRGEVETTDLISAGPITAKITLEENGNYTFETSEDGSQIYEETLAYTILPKPITVALAQTSGTYNGKPHTTDIKFNDVVATDKFELDKDFSVEYYRDDMTTATTDLTSVGEIKAVVTLLNKNYTFADGKTTVTLTYTIKEHIHNWKYEASGAVITATCQNDGCEIKSTTVTLKAPENLVYDGTAKSVIVDAPHADLLDKYTLKNSEGTDAGTYTAILTIADKTAILEFEITKAVITVTKVSAIDRVYDGKLAVAINKTDAIDYTGLIDGDKVGFDLSALTGTLSDANVGSNKSVKVSGSIVLTGEDAKNYMVSTPAETIVNITPATLTITPDAKTSEQYYKLPGLTYKVTGLIGTDTLTKAPALTTNADIKKTGDYTITATGAEASANYKITYAAGKMTITEHKNHIVATDGWKATVPGTCMVAGKEAGTCTLCSGTVTRDSKIDPNNHKLITTVTKKATCTQDGEALVTCANGCKYSLKTALPADGKSHTFATEFTVNNSTCVAKGSKYKPCQNPGCSVKSEYAEIPVNPDAHTKTEIINVKAENCTEEGYTGDTYCPDCKKVVKPGVEIPAKGHTEGDWIVDKPASFTEEGSQHKECTVCKTELKKEVIAKLALDTPVVKIANDGKGIKVSWSQDTDATGYTVYRSEYNPTTKKWTKWKNRGTAAATKKSWVDKTVKEGVTYKFTVRGVNGDNKSAYKETNGLLYVVAPKVKVSISSTGLLANWSKINNASGYIVYRATLGADGKWAKWVKLGTTAPEKNTWYDDKAVSGVTYKYTVRAVVNNVQSGYIGSSAVVYLAQPLLKISNTSTGVTGKWESIAGATGYIIYRSEYNTSTKKWTKWLNLGTTKATAKKFTDKTAKSGYTYKYTIRAINGKFKSTYQDSNKLIFLAQPTLKVSNVANGVQGKWNQVSGATGYIIYRSELKDGKWTGWTSLGTAKATAKSFTDKTVKSGVTYKYTIRAKNGAYKSSYVATGAVVFLSVPTVKISSGITGVNVSWSKITGATSYLVYRREVVNGKWSKWAELKTVTENSLVDETAKSGTQYRYTVRALNGKSRSMYTSTKTLHYLVAPTVTVEKAADGVKVNWTQVAGVTGYTIYRAELGADGKWSKWVTLGTASDKHSSCKDKTAKANVTYKYTVRAVNGKVKSAYVSGAQITNTAQ